MEDVNEIYRLSVKAWYKIATNNMLRCGHCGIEGPNSKDYAWNKDLSTLNSTIQTLIEIRNTLMNGV